MMFYIIPHPSISFTEFKISKLTNCVSLLIGLLSGFLICYSTYYYTGKTFKPIQDLKRITYQSSSLNVIYGLYIGNFSTVIPILIIAITVLFSDINYGIYGIAITSFGMLLNIQVIIMYQMFGPIADVTLGILNLLKFNKKLINTINQLDITGNTMSAVVKGYACGAGGLVSFGLYGAIMLTKKVINILTQIDMINIYTIECLILLILGALFTYVVQSLCMYSTSNNAITLVTYN
jgi:Na+/H+-translocating membrane pyrophosphatase